jgi:hypothetical protein
MYGFNGNWNVRRFQETGSRQTAQHGEGDDRRTELKKKKRIFEIDSGLRIIGFQHFVHRSEF